MICGCAKSQREIGGRSLAAAKVAMSQGVQCQEGRNGDKAIAAAYIIGALRRAQVETKGQSE
jgi:hypothetical protein